jgi:hypothetical protein
MKKIIALLLVMSSPLAKATSALNIELGFLNNSYNQVRIPGDTGTRFNLAQSLDTEFYTRLNYKKIFDNNHGMRLLYAPLTMAGNFTSNKDINFNGEIFTPGTRIHSRYEFHSYRATYFHRLMESKRWNFDLGATLKVRNASINLHQGDNDETRRNLGLVPLIYLWSEYFLSDRLRLVVDFDGLVAPQGRAIDVALMGGYKLNRAVYINVGYRMLEGGVDNDKVYNFAQFNHYFASFDIVF